MKRFLLCILAILMVASMVTVPAFAQQPAVQADEKVGDDALPSSFTLVGTPDLPPICNQGEVGCCASCAITYTQFTNAVSRYLRKYHPEIKFEPATGEKQYLFSPKWTYNFAGAGTAWVYHILQEQGGMTMDVSSFYLHPINGSFLVHRPTGAKPLVASAICWDIAKDQMEQAMNYRLKNFEQIWVGGNHELAKVDGKLEITTSDEGKALINKIKTSLNAGNVVVTGGLSGAWCFTDPVKGGRVVKTGDLGKRGDQALMFSRGDLVGGHQVSIVGYDDNITCEYNGTIMKGAFQVSNSWGTGWMNDGYVWLMYDALNERSEHEELNFEDRVLSMDQFCFVNWEEDVIFNDKPALYVEAEVSSKNRDVINLRPVVKSGEQESTFMPHMFEYYRYHPTFDELEAGDYFTIDGVKNGEEAKGIFTLDYYGLIADEAAIPGLSYGIRVQPRAGSLTVHALRLKNSRGQVLAEIELPQGGQTLTTGQTYYFDSELYKVTFEQEALEGSSFEAFSAYYNKGNKISFGIDVKEGYNAEGLQVQTDGGEKLEKNAEGLFELTVGKDTVISYSGIAKDQPVEPTPSVTPEPTVPSSGEEEKDSDMDYTVVIVAVIAVVVIAVIALACVIVFVLKKKKK